MSLMDISQTSQKVANTQLNESIPELTPGLKKESKITGQINQKLTEESKARMPFSS